MVERLFSPKMTTTCLMAAEAVVGVMTTGGVELELPLPAGLLSVPWPQPLRIRVKDIVRARSFRIIFEGLRILGRCVGSYC